MSALDELKALPNKKTSALDELMALPDASGHNAKKQTPASVSTRRPTLDVGDLINKGIFEKAEPSSAPVRTLGAAGAPIDVIPETFQQSHPTISKVANTILKPIDLLATNPFTKRVAQAANETRFIYEEPNKADTGSGGLNTAADLTGGILGFLTGGELSAGSKAFDLGVQGLKGVTSKLPSLPALAGKISPRLAPVAAKAAPYLASGAEMGAGGVAYEGVKAGSTGDSFTPADVGKIGLENFLAGLVFKGAGAGVSRLGNTLSRKAQEEVFDIGRDLGEQLSSRKSLSTMPGYKINNARAFESGKGFTSIPDYGYPSNYMVAPARSGGEVATLVRPEIPTEPVQMSKGGPQQLRLPDTAARAMNDLQAGIEEAQNYVRHNDILAPFKPGTTIEQAYASIKENTGIDLPQLMNSVEKAMTRPGLKQAAQQQAQYASLRRAAGLGPTQLGKTGLPVRPLGKMNVQRIEPQFPLPFKRVEEPPVVGQKPYEGRQDFSTRTAQPAEVPIEVQPVAEGLPKGTAKVEPVNSGTGDGTIKNADQLKDIGGWRAYMTDVYRNFKSVFGDQYETVKKRILDPFDESKKANVLHQEDWLNNLKSEVVDRLGIKKGSKESALVQQYGEKKISLEELKRQRPNDWQKIVEADQWFRKAYDTLIDEVNAVRRQIYPNAEKTMASIKAKIEATKGNKKLSQTEKQEKVAELEAKLEEAMRGKFVPKRQDYYRHFNDMAEGFAGLKNIFDTPANIDPKLAGISDFTQPKGRFAGFMQKRGLGKYKNDAVGGFLNYVPAASYSIHIDPHISKFSKLADELSEATTDSRNINNFINFLRKYSQDLAGKTNPADRFIQELSSRKVFNGVTWLNNRVKANTVIANAGSALAQLANVPLGIAHSKQYAVPGVAKTLKSIFFGNKEIAKSGFVKERFGSYGSKMYRQFDVRLIDQPKKMAVWLMETADKMGTHFIWNSSYAKAVAEGVKNPVKHADEVTRSLVAGRGVGEVPLLQKSKLFQIVAPFQLEVANLWSVQRDFVNAKDFGALVTLYLGNYMFNKIAEEIRGSGVTFDPMRAMIDAVTEEDISPLERGGRLAGEVLSNIPLGQTLAAAYPEYGMKIGDNQLPTRKKLFGRSDPTRFGTGPVIVKAIQEPQYKILPPFGGGQIKKTAGGISALKTGSVDDKKGNIKYPIAPDLANRTKGLLFGPGGFREAEDYYRNDRRPLSEGQTENLRQYGNDPQIYADIMLERQIETIERKIADIDKDPKLSQAEKNKQILALIRKSDVLQGGGK